jgi:hypothetical protein
MSFERHASEGFLGSDMGALPQELKAELCLCLPRVRWLKSVTKVGTAAKMLLYQASSAFVERWKGGYGAGVDCS